MKENGLPKIRLVLRDDREMNADKKHTLNYYIYLNGKTIKKPTGVYISPKNWNKKRREIVGSTKILEKYKLELSERIAEFDRYFLQLSVNKKGQTINAKSVHDFFDNVRFDDFCAYYERIATEKNTTKSKSTYNKYLNALKVFKKFCKSVRLNEITFTDISPRLIKDFDLYLVYDLELHSESVETGYHQKLRYVLNRAVVEEVIQRSPYLGFEAEKSAPNAPRIPLSEEEVKRIEGLEFNEQNKHLERIRDYFLFYCYTGVRFNELFNIRYENLTFNSFTHYDSKNKRTVTKPLTKPARWLIHKYNRASVSEFCFEKISNGYYNRALKDVAELAEIDKNLISHLGRHTLATTLRKKGVPLEDIGAILNQKDPKTPLTYAKPNAKNLLGYVEGLYSGKEAETDDSLVLISE